MSEHEFTWQDPATAGDNISVITRDGSLFDIQIEEPWAGSTETGFGRYCDISLPRDEAVRLAEWILAKAGKPHD